VVYTRLNQLFQPTAGAQPARRNVGLEIVEQLLACEAAGDGRHKGSLVLVQGQLEGVFGLPDPAGSHRCGRLSAERGDTLYPFAAAELQGVFAAPLAPPVQLVGYPVRFESKLSDDRVS